ncbi:tRNA (cytidine(34)-2'-O)-methyltransferase [Bdellovibrio sp. SKB1291214]|uniref:tRNA (cytidine(34)-2'-O)-methyltransferase n=1 Tax=Bdellovibrio sp. SKB1291214 TaxID=1732569 RepID=UPI000B51720F|nr:tRNA (cytidine(34)-2'-O)-methyltransferase [Bdellovibrio sp. SKB1291214]UYL10337.1 tRNA (cytidine(34)-2'-O)-methyltransferase [Bdellovibrio sp. SKB1291214]
MDNSKKIFRIVLIEPEIPQNTGNIGRTCVATNCELHIVGKMGFEINNTNVKRAGLDYWPHLTWHHHATFEDWWKLVEDPSRAWFFTTKTKRTYFEPKFQAGDWLVFGKETKGLDPDLLAKFPSQTVTIPMIGEGSRSLNLATSVAIAAYEGVRQIKYT